MTDDSIALDSAFLEQLDLAPASEVRRLLVEFTCRLADNFLDLPLERAMGPHDGFLDQGFDSLRAIDFKGLLEQRLGCVLRSTVLFDCPTPDTLVDHLQAALAEQRDAGASHEQRRDQASSTSSSNGHDARDPSELNIDELREALARQTARLAALEGARTEPIAVVGYACRFPGAETPEAFWQLQRDGVDAVTEVPASRWDVDHWFDPDPNALGKMVSRWGGFIGDVAGFDARLFGISPKEAACLDPQQRVLLEVAWQALERSAIAPDSLAGSPTGVFIGTRGSEYYDCDGKGAAEDAEPYFATGNASSTMAGRISYVLGFTGPCFAIDTACSSGLVAVHEATQSLRRGECSAALAGGVNLLLDPLGTVSVSKASMLSPVGRCKTFDASADGYVRSDGCGVVVMKRLSRALADGDPIVALIRGTAINQDGASGGLTVPSGPAQTSVIRLALASAGATPGEIDYIEAHGTGTSLGDPIEVSALDTVFAPGRPPDRPLVVGSVKTNIGHGETAAGMASLIKVLGVFEHECIPQHLHMTEPNPHIPWDETVIEVPTTNRPWPRSERPRMAGVSSFGFSGTNAHAVLEEAPERSPSTPTCPRTHELLCLSAHDEGALIDTARRLAGHLVDHPELQLGDICHTMNVGRAQLPRRLTFTATHRDELLAALSEVSSGQSDKGSVRAPSHPPRIAFLFTGQGSQYAGMARELYDVEPVFRSSLDNCAAVLDPLLPHPLFELLWGDQTELLSRTDCTQPALFAIEVSLSELWTSWGVTPSWVAGHSVGEYAAAVCAGVLSLTGAAQLVAARGRLMVELTEPGDMIVVSADREALQPLLDAHPNQLSVAAHNGPGITVLSGEREAIAAAAESLTADGHSVTPLDVSHAFHSPLMEPMLQPFADVANELDFAAPRVGFVSCLSGSTVSTELTNPDYWVRHVREPVRFADAMSALAEQRCDVLLELGPSPTLLGMARRVINDSTPAWLPSLRPGQSDGATLMSSLAQLWTAGANIDWSAVQRGHVRERLVLPTYPFQRERHWLPPRRRQSGMSSVSGSSHPLLGAPLDVATLGDGQQIFQSSMTALHPEWLADHSVYESTVVPAAAYAEWALAAAQERELPGTITIERLEVVAALLPGEAGVAIQLVTSPDDDGLTFQLFARPLDAGDIGSAGSTSWTLHASGRVVGDDSAPPAALDEAALRERCPDEQEVAGYYALYDEVGMGYGPAFRAINGLFRGEGELLAQLVLPESAPPAKGFVLHPVLLDACFQTCRVLAMQRDLTDMYLPLGIDALRLHATSRHVESGETLHVHTRLVSASDDGRSLVMDLTLYDAAGLPLASVESLRLITASRSALMAATDPLKTLAHQISWQAQERQTRADGSSAGHWLVLADEGGFGRDLGRELELAGGLALVVGADELKPDDAEAWSAIFNELNDPHRPCRGIVHLWGLDGAGADPADPERHRAVSGSLLALAQNLALAPVRNSPRVFVVTRGAVPASGMAEPIDLHAATGWAMASCLTLEHPEWRATRIDLDPLGGVAEASTLCEELLADDPELQLAWRNGERRVARLVRRPSTLPEVGLIPPPDAAAWCVGLSSYGVLENLTCFPMTRREPGAGEVEIAVTHTALNFKDVMFSLGLLREYTGVQDAQQQPLGLECAGHVVAVGEGVTELAPGQLVMASGPQCLASHVTVPVTAVAKVPAGVDAASAASLQTVFLTSIHALERCAQLRQGERVLIHAAAGGVGQAALAVARRTGAEIFATASPGKWSLLRRQGVAHVFSSRDTAFAAAINELTEGAGVDVVLNSLSGDAIEASLGVLAQGGRFVDIGKLDTWSNERMATARPDVAYHTFDMAEVLSADPALHRALLDELCEGLEDNSLTLPPLRVLAMQDGVEALRLLAGARTVGKLVLALPTPAPAAVTDGSWLITGGTGALGRTVTRWLVEQGARELVLCARSTPSPEASAELDELRNTGARIHVRSVDISDSQAVHELIASIDPPVRGVLHAAGVLADGMLVNQTWENFEQVMAPKVAGAWALHQATSHLKLDHFVMFSSMVSMVGAVGQGPYVAANGFLDGLAEHRRALGLPALSINWGPWAGAGMAAGSAAINRARFAELGIGAVGPEQGTAALGRLLADGAASSPRPGRVGVLPVTWSRFLSRFGPSGPPAFFASLALQGMVKQHDADPILEQLASASDDESRAQLLQEFVGSQLARVMGFGSASRIDRDQEFVDMGVDSLLAVDLRNRLEAALAVALPATLLFDHPTVTELVAELMAARRASGAEEQDEAALLAEIEQLSDDEVERLLAAEDEHD
jgi:myxalamid-type polyketide synthase MxaB